MTEAPVSESTDQIAMLFQYTVDAYKMFQKLAELLPNPIAAHTFENLAEDERGIRDLIEIKYLDPAVPRTKVKLEQDLRFQDALEGDMSHPELTEFLIAREMTMQRRLRDAAKNGPASERNLALYIAGAKRAHIAYLERELELLRIYPDWYKREDAESLVIRGRPVP